MPQLELRELDVRSPEWREMVDASATATFFHRPNWISVVSDVVPNLGASAVLAHDGRCGSRVLFPMARLRPIHYASSASLQLGPLFTYGGPIGGAGTGHERLAKLTSRIRDRLWVDAAAMDIHGNPWLPMPVPRGFADSRHTTHLVDLTQGMGAVRARYSKLQGRGIKAAEKAAVEIRMAAGRDDWLEYFRCYEDSLARWGDRATSSYPWELFDRMQREPANELALWLATGPKGVLAGAIIGLAGERAYYWHGATSAAAEKTMPSRLLWDRVFEYLATRGFKVVDLLSSGGHDGVRRFKESLGAEPLEYRSFSWRAGAVRRGAAKIARCVRHWTAGIPSRIEPARLPRVTSDVINEHG